MTLKHANRGAAMPAILALGIFIGASLALASPLGSRVGTPAPRHIVEAGQEPTQGGGSGTASEGSCAEAVSYLAGGDWGLSRAIDAVLESCEGNPRAPGLVNALAHLGANQEHGSQPSQAGGGSSVGPQGGGGGGQPAPGDGSGDDGSEDAEPGDDESEDAEPGDDGSEGAEPGDDGSEDDHGNSGHGDRDPNGNAYGHFDGKGNNG